MEQGTTVNSTAFVSFQKMKCIVNIEYVIGMAQSKHSLELNLKIEIRRNDSTDFSVS